MALKTYRDLEAWQKGMDLAVAAYKLGRLFPTNERFGLANQLQRAAASIPANLAEGYARGGRGEYVCFVSVARGSLAEVETHVTLAVRLELIGREQAMPCWKLCQEVGKILNKLIKSLESSSRNPEPRTRNPKRAPRN